MQSKIGHYLVQLMQSIILAKKTAAMATPLIGLTPNSAAATATPAAHKVLFGPLSNTSAGSDTRAWLNKPLNSDLPVLKMNLGNSVSAANQAIADAALKAKTDNFLRTG